MTLNDIERLEKINKDNLETFHKHKAKKTLTELISVIISFGLFFLCGYCCYQWGYTTAHNNFLQTQVEEVSK